MCGGGGPMRARGDASARARGSRAAAAERVARARVAGLEALPEPAHALLRRSVCERVGVRAAAAPREDAIVAHRGSRVEPLLDVALLELVTLRSEEHTSELQSPCN